MAQPLISFFSLLTYCNAKAKYDKPHIFQDWWLRTAVTKPCTEVSWGTVENSELWNIKFGDISVNGVQFQY